MKDKECLPKLTSRLTPARGGARLEERLTEDLRKNKFSAIGGSLTLSKGGGDMAKRSQSKTHLHMPVSNTVAYGIILGFLVLVYFMISVKMGSGIGLY